MIERAVGVDAVHRGLRLGATFRNRRDRNDAAKNWAPSTSGRTHRAVRHSLDRLGLAVDRRLGPRHSVVVDAALYAGAKIAAAGLFGWRHDVALARGDGALGLGAGPKFQCIRV